MKKLSLNNYHPNQLDLINNKLHTYFAERDSAYYKKIIYMTYYFDSEGIKRYKTSYERDKKKIKFSLLYTHLFKILLKNATKRLNELNSFTKNFKLGKINCQLKNKILDLEIKDHIDWYVIDRFKNFMYIDSDIYHKLYNLFTNFDELFSNSIISKNTITYLVKNYNDLLKIIKHGIKKMNKFLEFLVDIQKREETNLKCLVHTHAIFKIKYFVKKRKTYNFESHRIKTNNLFKEINQYHIKNNFNTEQKDVSIKNKLLSLFDDINLSQKGGKNKFENILRHSITAPSLFNVTKMLNNYDLAITKSKKAYKKGSKLSE